MPRLIQLTDLHLLCDPLARLKGVPIWETFREVLDHIKNNAGEWDLLVITGDLAHDELTETYQRLREELGDWLPRCRLIPGNHDNRHGLRQVFPDILCHSAGEFLSFQKKLGEWRVLGLDTQEPGSLCGRISGNQYDWLAQQMEEFPQNPALLFLHHPPISVRSPWLDKIGLENPQPLCDFIQAYPNIRAVATGHVHHVFQGKIGTTDLFTTPSTAIQFEPNGDASSYTLDPPGYRMFDLEETGYQTQVIRLPKLRFPPNSD